MDYYDSNDNQYKDGQGNGKNNGNIPGGRPVRQPNGTATASLICGIIGTLSLCACFSALYHFGCGCNHPLFSLTEGGTIYRPGYCRTCFRHPLTDSRCGGRSLYDSN
jgi:hypothetical protein